MSSDPQFSLSLKMWRLRLGKDLTALGSYSRLPCRIGRVVTQEELAEALGVSRSWYKMLESGAAVRTSLRLLATLADALMLSSSEKAQLFRLAFPELAVLEMVSSTGATSRDERITMSA